jgi:hypothetical protein
MGMSSDLSLDTRIFKGQKQHQPQKQQQNQEATKTPGEDAAGRCRACLTAFSSGSLRSPDSSAKPSGTRASRSTNRLCWRTSASQNLGPSALGNAH